MLLFGVALVAVVLAGGAFMWRRSGYRRLYGIALAGYMVGLALLTAWLTKGSQPAQVVVVLVGVVVLRVIFLFRWVIGRW